MNAVVQVQLQQHVLRVVSVLARQIFLEQNAHHAIQHIMTIQIATVRISHPLKMMHIPAMVYFTNDSDSQMPEHGMGGPTTLQVGEALYRICPFNYAQFLKKTILWNVSIFFM